MSKSAVNSLTEEERAAQEAAQRHAMALQQRRAALRLLKARQARDSLITFTEFTMPDIEDPEDAEKTRYNAQYFHKALAAALEEVEKGQILRLIITFPPRHGKSELTSRRLPAYLLGKDPYRHIIFATYNQPFAEDFGRNVRGIINSNAYKTVFPNTVLAKGSQAADRLATEEGGLCVFVGRGGSSTGRGADCLIIDDPLKDRQEADSATTREELWNWYNDTMSTRLMSDTGAIIIIQCMTGDTPVLMASGEEKPLRDIRPGDNIATYEDGKITTSTVRNWANQGPDHLFAIRMKSGIVVRANARHPFLVCEGGEEKWQRTDTLKRGDLILRAIGENGPVPSALPMDANCLPNARACACRTTTSSVGNPEFVRRQSILARTARLACAIGMELISRIMKTCLHGRAASAPSAKSLQAIAIRAPTGTESFASITATIAAKSEDFCATTATLPLDTVKSKAFCSQPPHTFEIIHDEVEEILDGGVEDVFDIQVERTENFIANGLVSHNTRWHEDDLVGRLTDPSNPCFNGDEAAQWKIINIPAIAGDDDILGRPKGAPLWPGRFGLEYLESFRRRNPRGFSALYQQQPTPDDGDFFQSHMITTYRREDLPKNLRIYAASDHAVGVKQANDRTCLLIIGIDERNVIWVLDAWWKRSKTDAVVDAMINLMIKWKPLVWWAERGHISASIGPFLFRLMREKKIYINVVEQTPVADKVTRAQSIQGRMSMGMVRFPSFEPWFEDAKQEMLKFPQARHDDFVDALAHVGLGLERLIKAPTTEEKKSDRPAVGTLGWVKADAKFRSRQGKLALMMRGM